MKERWIVMIVKQPFLRSLLLEDIEFKKTFRQNQEEYEDEQKRLDSETPKICPKCEQSYVPSQVNHGSCRYHDGFIVDIDHPKEIIKRDDAQMIIQRARLAAAESSVDPNTPKKPLPKLFWTCCLTLFVDHQPCKTDVCGLPDKLKEEQFDSDEHMRLKVQECFESNQLAKGKIDKFIGS